MGVLQIAAIVLLMIASVHLWLSNNKNKKLLTMVANQIQANNDVRRTLAMGLYSRFKKKEYNKDGKPVEEKHTELFIREDPWEFEDFVAGIYEKLYGGHARVTPGSGEFGVDIKHRVAEKVYYIQVKCEKNNLAFNPIALIHSNMEKHGADGGVVVTTSDFSKNAKSYAEGLNVELINGIELVDMWIKSLELQKDEITQLYPE